MRCLVLVPAMAAVSIALAANPSKSTPIDDELRRLAEGAVAEDPRAARAAAERLRAAGPVGLEALLTVHQELWKRYVEPEAAPAAADVQVSLSCSLSIAETESTIADGTRSVPATLAENDPDWVRLREALDLVGGQRHCHTSRLFWYTDLEQAKAAAREAKKPILSLRLLGRLTDEYSCANSRFFRTALYANQQVGQVLRERFVLHWESERPVPKVTIDFGDGRRIERTLTGNSIHYMLDAQGRPIDALPGLHGPQAFLRWLNQTEKLARDLSDVSSQPLRQVALLRYHTERVAAIDKAWKEDLEQLGVALPEMTPANAARGARRGDVRNAAVDAQRRAMTKSVVEIPVLAAIAPNPAEVLAGVTTDDLWPRIAERHKADAALDAASLAFIRSQHLPAGRAAADAVETEDDPLSVMVRNFENAIALDTVRNEYVMHRQIHGWFTAAEVGELAALNERVYAELFLTPSSDPWLGLYPHDAYTGLANNGVVE